MSIHSIVTGQDLINLRKLAKQQTSQRAEKIKNRILKQTHDINLAESLNPITKKLDEVKKSTQKTGVVIKESQQETPQLAIEKTRKALPTGNEQIQPGVSYDTSLENTINNMKNNTGFFNIKESDDGDIFRNGFPVEKIGGNKLKINEKVHNITPGIQKVLTDTSNIPLKKLNDKDREIFNNILESLYFENYRAIRGESKSSRYTQPKTILKNIFWKAKYLKNLSYHLT